MMIVPHWDKLMNIPEAVELIQSHYKIINIYESGVFESCIRQWKK